MKLRTDQENMRQVRRLIITSERGVRQAWDGGIEICCVCCGAWKTLPHYGMRYMKPRDELRNQSWCTQCRSEERLLAREDGS